MGYGFGIVNNKEVGYNVPDTCHNPECFEEIDRGLGHVCGDWHGEGEFSCGGYFCGYHLYFTLDKDGPRQLCLACCKLYDEMFEMKEV